MFVIVRNVVALKGRE